MQPSPAPNTREKRSIKESLVWMFSSQGLLSGMQLAVLMVLGRLLDPAEFGVVTIFVALAQISAYLATLGFGPALVQNQTSSDVHTSTALVVALAGGLTIGTLTYLVREPLLGIFQLHDQSRLAWLFIPLCVVTALHLLLRFLMQKQTRFRAISTIETGSFLLTYAAPAVVLAVKGFGASAVILAFLSNLAANSVAFFFVLRPAWKGGFRWDAARELCRTGLGFGLAEFVSISTQNLDKLIAGSTLGLVAAGLYGRAQALMLAGVHILTAPLDSVLFPAFSEAQAHSGKLRALFGKTQVLAMLLGLPPALIMVCAPEGIILVLLGPNWSEAAPLLRVFALLILIRVNGRALDFVLRARALVYRRLALTLTFCGLTALFVVGGARFGLTGVALGLTTAFFCHGILLVRLAIRELEISWAAFLTYIAPPMVWGAGMGALVILGNATSWVSRMHPVVMLVADSVVIGLAFGLTLGLRPGLMFGPHADTARALLEALLRAPLQRLGLARRPEA